MDGYTTVFRPGLFWVAGRRFDQQRGYREHLRWLKRLARLLKARPIGIVAPRFEMMLVVWNCTSLPEAQLHASTSPLVRSGTATALTTPGAPQP